ncbi:MAG: PAS domain S-box protein [Proteobacteria bacterium]|nr:PAS domain S-box protein [Pseudomonadota bacterium]
MARIPDTQRPAEKTLKIPSWLNPGSRGAAADLQAATAQVAAINRSQAVIEFDLEGTILTANGNFLKTLGYELDEIRGHHHSMFVEPAQRESAEYKRFWEKLGRGEFEAAQYLRIGKGGRRVWIQATYNPVFDAEGRPARVIKFATDITARKHLESESKGVHDAIDRVSAVIEFELDGTILTANANFLKVLGYGLEEIRGRHHSMFVDPAQRDSAEYKLFWEKLGRGHFDAGRYMRIGRDGRQVWLQASYNPIFNAEGRAYKVMKFATDITAEITASHLSAVYRGALDNATANVMVADNDCNIIYMNRAASTLMAAGESDFRKDLPAFNAAKLVGGNIDAFHRNPAHQRRMLAGLNGTFTSKLKIGGRTMRITANPMSNPAGTRIGTVVEWGDLTQELATETEVQDMVTAVLAGDLGKRIAMAGKSGFHQNLSQGINSIADSMVKVVAETQNAAQEISRGADEISQGSMNLSQRTEEQASSLEQTASSMEQMTSTVRQNADNAGQANQLAVAARDQAEKGGAVVARAVTAMGQINESSRKIADIIGVIDEIAFQTNLLALNAAVEAARAGEQGRGFAVVAAEVRSLAGRSATAAKEIKALIQDSVKKVEEGSSLVTQSGGTLEQIVGSVKKVTDIVGEIAAASREQSSGIEQVNKAVMQLDELTQQNAALVEQSSAASQAMAEQARGLNHSMTRFRLERSAGAVLQAVNSPAPLRTAAR